MPRIVFDWYDELITSRRIHYLFTDVCKLRDHVRCDRDRACHSSFRIRWVRFYWNMSLTGLNYPVLHRHSESTSNYSWLPLRRECRSCMPLRGGSRQGPVRRLHGECWQSSFHACKHRGQEILDPCGHYCDSSMITC